MSTAINDLPRDIFFMVFSYFPFEVLNKQICFVCKEWNKILTDPLFWRFLSHNADISLLKQKNELAFLANEIKEYKAFYFHLYCQKDDRITWTEFKIKLLQAESYMKSGIKMFEGGKKEHAKKFFETAYRIARNRATYEILLKYFPSWINPERVDKYRF